MSELNKGLIKVGDGTHIVDFKALQEGAEEEQRKRAEQYSKTIKVTEDKHEKEQAEWSALMTKVGKDICDNNVSNRSAEMEAEKAKAIAEVEAKYESHGLKSEHTRGLDNAYRDLIKDI
ncbi:hypothetical protein [Lactococcus petauri]|uniref:hypothetical protein n=1 Tax=Lactococcus petauri TaxID=1940789 RepID=UPI00220412E6|nr:hypothetical protein LMK05_11545 [Lactococcus petauri]